MAIAVVATLLIHGDGQLGPDRRWASRSARPSASPRRASVKMTAMPQMVALFNGVGGGAVALIAWVEFRQTRRLLGRADLHRDLLALRGDRRLGLLLGLEHRLRQAPGAHPRPADHDRAAPADRSTSRCCCVAVGAARWRSPPARDAELLMHRHPRRRGAARQLRRAADRRRRHAGRHLAAERLHRPVGRRDRDRAEQHRADRRGHDRRRLRHDPHATRWRWR